MTSLIAGIDLGTTHSLIGVMEAGFPVLIADAEGRRLTPSVVHYPEEGTSMVGLPALRMAPLQPEHTVVSVKRRMGERTRKGPMQARPEEVSAEILRKLRADAERALEEKITRAVISVPAYFNEQQRSATKRAGELAGLKVERILNEPTAAALAYGCNLRGRHLKIAVYDFGGGTFDITLLALENGIFEVLATSGNTALGGDDIDAAIAESLRLQLGLKNLTLEECARLGGAAGEAKHRLSEKDETTVRLPFLSRRSAECTLSRSELERLARPIIELSRRNCLRALSDARLDPADLDEVILVGGTTRMPLVRHFVQEFFGREPDTSQNPDEAVAIGATLQAGILSGSVSELTLLDVTPLSLGIETFGGLMNVLIPRNTTIPAKAGEMFTNAVAGQQSMLVRVLQGEREMARDNLLLGEIEVPFTPAPKGKARVGVQFEIDADGLLHVLARDIATGRDTTLTLRSAVDVDDAAVNAMLDDSLEHAFEDMNERIRTEAKVKAEEMLPAVQRALEQVGALLPQDHRERIESRISEVRRLIENGSARELKAAVERLDEETEDLALLLVDAL